MEESMSNLTVADLKDRAVVSIGQAEKIGRVEDVILDLAEGRVAGFHVRTGLLGGAKILSAGDIHDIGPDAITVADRSALEGHAPDQPMLDSLPTSADLIGAKVVSAAGTLLGTLANIALDPAAQRVLCYELGGSLWDQLRNEQRTFDPAPGIRFGKDLIVVPDAVAAELNRRSGAPPSPPESLTPPPPV
jgi:uncharacterized protein YrrD